MPMKNLKSKSIIIIIFFILNILGGCYLVELNKSYPVPIPDLGDGSASERSIYFYKNNLEMNGILYTEKKSTTTSMIME